MMEPRPLQPTHIPEVPLPQAPLAAVVAQVRFAPILAIGQSRASEAVAAFQEELRSTYPHLTAEDTHQINMTSPSQIDVGHSRIWRLADSANRPSAWRVSLAQDFVSLETRQYHSRRDFLDRLRAVINATATNFSPTDSTRFGLRYIDQLTGTAASKVADLVVPEVLGVHASGNGLAQLRSSIVHSMMLAQFLAPNDDTVLARWGVLPPNTTHAPDVLDPVDERSWVLDMDMSTTRPHVFSDSSLVRTAEAFAESLYWLFRQMVKENFLRYHGANL